MKLFMANCFKKLTKLQNQDCVTRKIDLFFECFSYKLSFPETYNVDPRSLTVSGISSGGAMSTQFHFIYSSDIKGAGIFAAGLLQIHFNVA
jgi:hypothetical protein